MHVQVYRASDDATYRPLIPGLLQDLEQHGQSPRLMVLPSIVHILTAGHGPCLYKDMDHHYATTAPSDEASRFLQADRGVGMVFSSGAVDVLARDARVMVFGPRRCDLFLLDPPHLRPPPPLPRRNADESRQLVWVDTGPGRVVHVRFLASRPGATLVVRLFSGGRLVARTEHDGAGGVWPNELPLGYPASLGRHFYPAPLASAVEAQSNAVLYRASLTSSPPLVSPWTTQSADALIRLDMLRDLMQRDLMAPFAEPTPPSPTLTSSRELMRFLAHAGPIMAQPRAELAYTYRFGAEEGGVRGWYLGLDRQSRRCPLAFLRASAPAVAWIVIGDAKRIVLLEPCPEGDTTLAHPQGLPPWCGLREYEFRAYGTAVDMSLQLAAATSEAQASEILRACLGGEGDIVGLVDLAEWAPRPSA